MGVIAGTNVHAVDITPSPSDGNGLLERAGWCETAAPCTHCAAREPDGDVIMLPVQPYCIATLYGLIVHSLFFDWR